jgi:hypothetical protein
MRKRDDILKTDQSEFEALIQLSIVIIPSLCLRIPAIVNGESG